MKILCITPIEHIQGVYPILDQCGWMEYVPEANKEVTIAHIKQHYHEAIFVNPNMMTFRLDKDVLLPSIRYVVTASTGTHHIDLDYCEEQGIEVISLTTDYETINKISSTAEHAFALMMSLIRNIPRSYDSVLSGKWDYQPYIGRQLSELTVGVVGYGRLGKMFARYCEAFGCRVKAYDPYVDTPDDDIYSLESLFWASDIISLHVHLNDKTRHMINEDLLLEYTHGGCNGKYLINTSRGSVVDENAVIEALDCGRLLGYATDVLEDELGDVHKSKMIEASRSRNIIITPHIGGMTKEAQEIAYQRVANKLLEKINE